MINKQRLTRSLTILALSCLSTVSFAKDLVIDNQTNENSTCKTYGKGKCSTELLKENGVTPAHQSRTYTEPKLRIACYPTPENCTAEVYADDNCSGAIIATAVFDLRTGIKSITTIPNGPYVIDAPIGGFKVTLRYR